MTQIHIVEDKGILQAGQMRRFGDRWLLACPNCGSVARLDHEVSVSDGKPTIAPSLVCECGAHFHVTDGEVVA